APGVGGALAGESAGGRAPTALVVDDGGTTIAEALERRGVAVSAWRRHAVGTQPGAPFPPDGVFDRVVLRLPRGRETLGMLASWLAARTAPDGALWVAGRNDEGIRSAGATLAQAFEEVTSRESRRHCRILACRGPRADVRADPSDWLQCHQVGERSWVSWPGSFAHGRIDPGTALLLSVLPRLAETGDPFARTLDLGCGSGLVAMEVVRLRPGGRLVGLDADALALEAARRNVPELEARCLDASVSIGKGNFTAIVTNPPVHQGSSFDRDLTAAVLTRALAALAPNGILVAVALRGVPLGAMMSATGREVTVAAEDPRYRVWVAR
ncbi:MAG: class I SAM-dependent methyltransferase, partial [Deltaproteobacteria bacterium]|nr:class I SAM-dependent methyltransferase [Deltaproteobacteria bacterium]